MEVSDALLLPTVMPLPIVTREPFPCEEPPIFDFKIERVYTKLNIFKVLNAVTIDNYAKTLVVSTLDTDFIGHHVSLRITLDQDLTDIVDEKLVIIDFIPPTGKEVLLFAPIPLTSRIIGGGVE